MIELSNVEMSFGAQQVLRGISLQVHAGETVAIIGQSGCGKSVLLKSIVGLLRPTRGEITIDGVAISSASNASLANVRRSIGFLFQSAALFDSMTVEENITIGLYEHGVRDHDALREIAKESLALVGLGSILEKYPSELSGGMQKRVGLARALAGKPKYLFYDEPTTGLDPVTSEQIDRLIESLTQQLQVTSLVVTHDMFTVNHTADRVLFLDGGVIAFDGSPATLHETADARIREFLARYGSTVRNA